MVEVGIAEYFGMAEAIGIIAAVVVVMYYSRKQMQALSVDIEPKVLNDLDEKMHAAGKGISLPSCPLGVREQTLGLGYAAPDNASLPNL